MYSLPQSYNQTSKCKRCISSNAYVVVESEDKGVSFAYQINGKGYNEKHWFLYTGPVKLRKGDRLSVVAVRAGMKNSEIVEFINK